MTSWRSRLALALRIVLAAIFIVAAWSKLRQPWQIFAFSIDSYQLLPEWGVILAARTLPWVELLLGVVLLSGLFLRTASVCATGILLLFMAAIVRSYFKGLQIDCGCFGVGEALSVRTILRDSAFLAASVALTWLAFRDVHRRERAT